MLTCEADQRHADLLMASCGLTPSTKTKATTWDKVAFLARHPLAGPFLDEKRRVAFRSNCMCLYLALDRPDIQFTAEEISRAMASPTISTPMKRSRLFRGTWPGHPRVLWRYPQQEWPGKVWGLTDSNWAACPVTRKSSPATYLMLGRHPIFAASSTQTILSLSSGEAEFCGAVRCACRTLGLKSLLSDLSLEVKAKLVSDSSACKGLCSRRGAGKFQRQQMGITRRAEKDLAPDVGTKAGIPDDTMWRLLGMFGLAKAEGRAKQALKMAGRQAEA